MAAKKKAAKKTDGAKALEFARAYLRDDPSAAYATIRDAAKKRRITLHPISYGRAKALEGLVRVSAYGSKKKKKKAAAGSGAVKRGPGRPKGSKNKIKRGPGRPRKVPSAGLDSIDGLVSTLKTLQRERDDALRAVERIRGILASM